MTTTPLTLADYAAEPTPLVAGVAKILREESKFMDVLPFHDAGSLSVKVIREGSMPNVSWRRIGADHGSVKGAKPTEITENAFSIGNEIDVDIAYMKDKSARLYNPMTYQTHLITKAIARNFTDKAINGLPTDKDNPVGLYFRTMNDLPSSQRISAGVDISSDNASLSSAIQTYIDKLDELLYAVTDNLNGGEGVYLLTNDTAILRTNAAFRQSGLLKETEDALGRTFLTYKGAQFIDMGLKYDEATRIIGNVELANGTALTGGPATSIYAIKVGKENFTAWQEYGLTVSPPELQSNKVTYKSVIDWVVGLAIAHPRSVARLYGVTAA